MRFTWQNVLISNKCVPFLTFNLNNYKEISCPKLNNCIVVAHTARLTVLLTAVWQSHCDLTSKQITHSWLFGVTSYTSYCTNNTFLNNVFLNVKNNQTDIYRTTTALSERYFLQNVNVNLDSLGWGA